MKVNLNTFVRVTLTEYGLRRLRDYYADLGHDPPPAQDTADRPVVFLLWQTMHIFGPTLYLGCPALPFVNDVIEITEA